MADGKNPTNVTVQSNDLVDAAGKFGTSLARVGALVVSLPFYILPVKERDDAIAATNNLFNAVGELHLSIVRAAVRGVTSVTREITKSVNEDGSAPALTSTKVPIETGR